MALLLIVEFLAVIFNVFALKIPDGFAIQIGAIADDAHRPTVFAPPPSISMNKNAETVIVVSRTSIAGHKTLGTSSAFSIRPKQLVLHFKSFQLIQTITTPSGTVFASQPFGAAAPLDAQKRPVFSDLQASNIVISDAGKIYVSQKHHFDGAFSGVDLWSFDFKHGRWHPVPALSEMQQGANLVVTTSSNDNQIGYVVDHEGDTNYSGSEAQTGVTDRDEAWVRDGNTEIAIGNGTVSAISNRNYVGYNTSFTPASPHFAKPPIAFKWSRGHKTILGYGLAWAVNKYGVVVGDNRKAVACTGQPIAWYDRHPVLLSNLAGSAFSINDRNEVVGDLEARGAFLASFSDRGASLKMLDNDLSHAAHGWHVAHAYAIASNGSILAVGNFENGPPQMVLLVAAN